MRTTPEQTAKQCLAIPAVELAELLNVSERHLWGMLATGRLGPQPIALGRAKRWPVDEVKAWLAAGAPDRDTWQAMRGGDTR
ncbi:phage transcriptional regulator, AlpA [Pirellula staleyi DSM 6068]|uniref:Phage transcriptional regulator, AlpA n=1 Tax=Pirellula staleyi (strain ATCC 27377 / DSM 6068 / ICPB 4128) TaxID=530564 RepID=D2R1G8_PIRSD|nr:phage transcriptional regulator, AlpA [Pirellula staleyi DSM 6068]